MKFRQINEAFDWVFKGEGTDEQVRRLKEVAKFNQAIVPIVRMGVGAEKPEWVVPEGQPELEKLDETLPDGMGQTTITQEWRRIQQFFTSGSNLMNLNQLKIEFVWVQILEGLQKNEVAILTAVKDGKLLDLYPQFEAILPTLGINEYNKPKPKKKRAPRRKKA